MQILVRPFLEIPAHALYKDNKVYAHVCMYVQLQITKMHTIILMLTL